HRPTSIGDFDGLSSFHPAQQFARSLTELTDAYTRHVLCVAQSGVDRGGWGELPPLLKRGDPVALAKTAGRFWGTTRCLVRTYPGYELDSRRSPPLPDGNG